MFARAACSPITPKFCLTQSIKGYYICVHDNPPGLFKISLTARQVFFVFAGVIKLAWEIF